MFYQNVVAYCEENNLSIHAFEKMRSWQRGCRQVER